MRRITREGREKPPGRQHQATVVQLRPPADAAWCTVDHLLLPGARADIERLACEVQGSLEAERRGDPTALRRDRERRRTEAKHFDREVTTLFSTLRALRTHHRAVLGLEPDTARAF